MDELAADEVIDFVEQLSNAASQCLADDLTDLASNMRSGRRPEYTEPVAEAIRARLRVARIDELWDLMRHPEADLVSRVVLKRIRELEAEGDES